jgi:CDP-glucose 4,6-dehydratase
MREKFWRDRRVFVTGGSEFLGGWVVRKLLERGAEVSVFVRDGAPRSMMTMSKDIDRVISIQGSAEDLGLLRRASSEYSIHTVFHLAAQPLVGVAKMDPLGRHI